MTSLKSLIVGPGAIGALTCVHIQAFSDVFVYEHRQKLELATSLIIGDFKNPLHWALIGDTAPAIDVIWVCCKANQVSKTIPQLLHRFPEAVAILLHNGMGPQQQLQDEFDDRILVGSTTCGALPDSPKSFTQTSFGKTFLGFRENNARHQSLKRILLRVTNNTGPLAFCDANDIDNILWRKLLINACINPLTAFHQIQNGKLLKLEFRQEITEICREVMQIMQAAGVAQMDDPIQAVLDVAQMSQHNWSSMAMDLKMHRKTEIDYINGFLIDRGLDFNIPTPTLEKWYKRIAFNLES